MEASFNFSASFTLDSDEDGWTDYMEQTYYYTDPQQADGDGDGVSDTCDIDPYTDLEVTFTVKRINASVYTYTWREGETWNYSKTDADGGPGCGTKWIVNDSSEASGDCYTRQNDSRVGIGDIAMWNFTVKKSGVYFIWMRCHRYDEASSNICLSWNNKLFYHKAENLERHWYDPTHNEWKWSWFGRVEMDVGDGTLKIENLDENNRDGEPEWWMEVDNILITDDPNCHPSGKGAEGSDDYSIGYTSNPAFDTGSPPDFYIKATIAGTVKTSSTVSNDYNVLPDWSTVVDVPDDEEEVPITIELWDEDIGDDTLCDINWSSGKKCNITYNLKNATWWGDDHVLDTDFIGRTCGEVDGKWDYDANVIFEIDQNDNDNDGITYWQETDESMWNGEDPIDPTKTNDRYAVVVSGGASCKMRQKSNHGSIFSPYKGTYLVYDNGYSWTDYTFSVDLMTNEFPGLYKEEIGIMFRYQNSNNYYLLRWEKCSGKQGRMILKEVVNDVWSTLFNEKSEKTSLKNGDWYTLKVTLDGNNIKLEKNNNRCDSWVEIFNIYDSSLSSGTVALFTWKNKGAWFDDILDACGLSAK